MSNLRRRDARRGTRDAELDHVSTVVLRLSRRPPKEIGKGSGEEAMCRRSESKVDSAKADSLPLRLFVIRCGGY